MFSKSRINEPGPKAAEGETKPNMSDTKAPSSSMSSNPVPPPAGNKPKAAPSTLSSDLVIKGNLKSTGDILVEGTVEGDIRAHTLTVGEGATIKGEIVADDVVVDGRIIGRLRGLKVRLTASARVEGDIIHKTIAIESGAHFEGTVARAEDPLSNNGAKPGAGGAKAS
ncbi:MAG TPA: polymer-forming cytoskeletal protein [Aliiroseovarius sp.]|nr:polymer-forming cytoskeletal protein [Aliiroseovarius sp.]